MQKYFIWMLVLISPLCVWGQGIPKDNLPHFTVEQHHSTGKEQLMLSFGVTLSDCIQKVIVRNIDNNRTFYFYPDLDDYYLREEGTEEIYTKFSIGRLNKIVTQSYGMHAEVTIISKAGAPIYKGRVDFVIEREDDSSEKVKNRKLADASSKNKRNRF